MSPVLAVVLIFLCAAVLCAAFWLFCMLPRMRCRPDFSALRAYDYAHRGYHEKDQSIPENSLPSFQRAVENGFGMELDVQLSSDGEVMVFHDATLSRMCGDDRAVRSLTCAELERVSLKGTSYGVPRFSQVLEAVGGKTPIIVEVKKYGDDAPELCEKTCALLQNYKGDWCAESFHPEVVAWFRKNHPEVVRGQLMSNFKDSDEMGNVKAFFARNLFSNVLTRPDFMAYDYEYRDNFSLHVSKRLFHVQEVSWTLRTKEALARVKADGGIGIFENFDPRG